MNFNYEKFLCGDIYKKLLTCYEYGEMYSCKRYQLFGYLTKIDKNFDIKNCAEYSNFPKEIQTITQSIETNKHISPASSYLFELKNNNLNIKYEFESN